MTHHSGSDEGRALGLTAWLGVATSHDFAGCDWARSTRSTAYRLTTASRSTSWWFSPCRTPTPHPAADPSEGDDA